MSDLDDNQIHSRLERLSKVEPTQQASDRAMQRVRDTISRGRPTCLPGASYGLTFFVVKLSVAAVILIGLAFLAGRLSAPAPLDAEALQTMIRQDLLDEMDDRLQMVLASERETLKQELRQQVAGDLQIFADQTLTTIDNLTDQRFMEFARMVEAARIKDRQRVAAALNYMGSRFGDGLVTLAAQTNELQRPEQN